jgi:hypothetical protein
VINIPGLSIIDGVAGHPKGLLEPSDGGVGVTVTQTWD